MQVSIRRSSQIAVFGIMLCTLGGTASALELNACQQTTPKADYVEITGGSTTCDPSKEM